MTSVHKLLPGYTQAALVLARTQRLDPGRLERGFEATNTTSPAGAILASIDAARALLARDGERLVGRAVALEILLAVIGDALAVAVMRLVIQDDDVLQAHQLRHDPLEHLAFALGGAEVRAAALEQGAPDFGDFEASASFIVARSWALSGSTFSEPCSSWRPASDSDVNEALPNTSMRSSAPRSRLPRVERNSRDSRTCSRTAW